jgi:hypothetical protein
MEGRPTISRDFQVAAASGGFLFYNITMAVCRW